LVPESIDWEMRVAQRQATAEAQQRWAQTQTIEQHQLQGLTALRTGAMQIPCSVGLSQSVENSWRIGSEKPK